MRALVLAVCLASPACFTTAGPSECRVDGDCDGLICTRVRQCASEVRSLRIEWTVRGMTTDQAAACAGVSELEVTITDPTTGDDHSLRPVPCAAGSFFFDKLPVGYTEVAVAAYGGDESLLDVERGSAGAGGVVRLALLRP